MSNEYLTAGVKKVVETAEYKFPLNFAMASAWILSNYKGTDLKVFDVSKHSTLADFFIIGSATNLTQAQSMAEAIIRQFKKNGHKVLSAEGLVGQDWILIDTGDVITHIFVDGARKLYDLDSLWSHHKQVQIPEEFYFGPPEGVAPVMPEKVQTEDEGYF